MVRGTLERMEPTGNCALANVSGKVASAGNHINKNADHLLWTLLT